MRGREACGTLPVSWAALPLDDGRAWRQEGAGSARRTRTRSGIPGLGFTIVLLLVAARMSALLRGCALPSRGGRRKLHPDSQRFPLPHRWGGTPRRSAIHFALPRNCHSERGPIHDHRGGEDACRASEESSRGRSQAGRAPPQPRPREPAPRSVRPPLFRADAGVARDGWPHPRGRLLQRKRTLRGAGSRRGRRGGGNRACRRGGADSSTGPPDIPADSVMSRQAPLGMTHV